MSTLKYKPVSDCCQAHYTIRKAFKWGRSYGETSYYICDKCSQYCEPHGGKSKVILAKTTDHYEGQVRLTSDDHEAVIDAYNDGMSVSELVRLYSVPERIIQVILKRIPKTFSHSKRTYKELIQYIND